jgi:rhodanese-related sulfurtransferase
MIKRIVILAVLLALGVGGLALNGQQAANNKTDETAASLSIQTIKNDVGQGGQLVDVRTIEEYNDGHIDGAINLTLQDIEAGQLPDSDKDKPLYLYCRSGNRSGQATVILKKAGFTNIIDLGAMTYVESLGGVIKKS